MFYFMLVFDWCWMVLFVICLFCCVLFWVCLFTCVLRCLVVSFVVDYLCLLVGV